MADLHLYNSLTRKLEPFVPVHDGEARVYTCGPTVYNYPHIGNMRAYVFADTLGRVLSYKGYKLTHVINITDVGHLTDDADAGEDKLEKAAKANAQSIWDIARHYTEAYWADVRALNIREPAHWSIATDYVPQMIAFAESIAAKHCYQLASGLYFDTSTVTDYGKLARDDAFLNALSAISTNLREHLATPAQAIDQLQEATAFLVTTLRTQIKNKALDKYLNLLVIWEPLASLHGEALTDALPSALEQTRGLVRESRIKPVDGKRNEEDFAIWRTTPPGEARQMEWDSPWGKGAPGWHLECSVMSEALLGLPFDIHTGGIDHREIHHPNEIAQNQARCSTDASGANIWMHNNFLIDRTGKMSKSSGEFLRLQLLIDKGFHPLAYRLMCLQAHYRSELEFSWEGLLAAFVRLKRMVMAFEEIEGQWRSFAQHRYANDPDTDTLYEVIAPNLNELTHEKILQSLADFDAAVGDDLNTPKALTILESTLGLKRIDAVQKHAVLWRMLEVLGFDFDQRKFTRKDLRIRPKSATITEAEIETTLAARREARAAKDFARSDGLRDQLIAAGVEVMDGDPLGWDWRIQI